VTGIILYTLARYVGEHSARTGELPPALDPIVAVRPEVWVWERYATGTDVWGRTVRYTPGGGGFQLRSAGPDGVFDTADDLVAQGLLGRDRPCTVRNEFRETRHAPPCPDEPAPDSARGR
jgi:hypothetical protein